MGKRNYESQLSISARDDATGSLKCLHVAGLQKGRQRLNGRGDDTANVYYRVVVERNLVDNASVQHTGSEIGCRSHHAWNDGDGNRGEKTELNDPFTGILARNSYSGIIMGNGVKHLKRNSMGSGPASSETPPPSSVSSALIARASGQSPLLGASQSSSLPLKSTASLAKRSSSRVRSVVSPSIPSSQQITAQSSPKGLSLEQRSPFRVPPKKSPSSQLYSSWLSSSPLSSTRSSSTALYSTRLLPMRLSKSRSSDPEKSSSVSSSLSETGSESSQSWNRSSTPSTMPQSVSQSKRFALRSAATPKSSSVSGPQASLPKAQPARSLRMSTRLSPALASRHWASWTSSRIQSSSPHPSSSSSSSMSHYDFSLFCRAPAATDVFCFLSPSSDECTARDNDNADNDDRDMYEDTQLAAGCRQGVADGRLRRKDSKEDRIKALQRLKKARIKSEKRDKDDVAIEDESSSQRSRFDGLMDDAPSLTMKAPRWNGGKRRCVAYVASSSNLETDGERLQLSTARSGGSAKDETDGVTEMLSTSCTPSSSPSLSSTSARSWPSLGPTRTAATFASGSLLLTSLASSPSPAPLWSSCSTPAISSQWRSCKKKSSISPISTAAASRSLSARILTLRSRSLLPVITSKALRSPFTSPLSSESCQVRRRRTNRASTRARLRSRRYTCHLNEARNREDCGASNCCRNRDSRRDSCRRSTSRISRSIGNDFDQKGKHAGNRGETTEEFDTIATKGNGTFGSDSSIAGTYKKRELLVSELCVDDETEQPSKTLLIQSKQAHFFVKDHLKAPKRSPVTEKRKGRKVKKKTEELLATQVSVPHRERKQRAAQNLRILDIPNNQIDRGRPRSKKWGSRGRENFPRIGKIKCVSSGMKRPSPKNDATQFSVKIDHPSAHRQGVEQTLSCMSFAWGSSSDDEFQSPSIKAPLSRRSSPSATSSSSIASSSIASSSVASSSRALSPTVLSSSSASPSIASSSVTSSSSTASSSSSIASPSILSSSTSASSSSTASTAPTSSLSTSSLTSKSSSLSSSSTSQLLASRTSTSLSLSYPKPLSSDFSESSLSLSSLSSTSPPSGPISLTSSLSCPSSASASSLSPLSSPLIRRRLLISSRSTTPGSSSPKSRSTSENECECVTGCDGKKAAETNCNDNGLGTGSQYATNQNGISKGQKGSDDGLSQRKCHNDGGGGVDDDTDDNDFIVDLLRKMEHEKVGLIAREKIKWEADGLPEKISSSSQATESSVATLPAEKVEFSLEEDGGTVNASDMGQFEWETGKVRVLFPSERAK